MRNEYINEARRIAEKSLLKRANHGAVVVYRGKIVGRGYNKYCVEGINKVNRWSVHAEVDAINNALRTISKDNLKQSTLIVVRILKEGTVGLSTPCKCCANYIQKYQMKACFYS